MSATVFPISGPGVAPSGQWSQDQGVDISAPGGSPLVAVESGVVKYVNMSGFTNNAPTEPILYGDSGNVYYYGHAGATGELKSGTHVNQGDVIGSVGQGIVGISTGPHLEFGLADASGAPKPGTSSEALAILKGAAPPPAGGGSGGGVLGAAGDLVSTISGAISDPGRALLYIGLVLGGALLVFLGVRHSVAA